MLRRNGSTSLCIALATAPLAAACSSGDVPSTDAHQCTMTLGGVLTGTFACQATAITSTIGDGVTFEVRPPGANTLSYDTPGGVSSISVELSFAAKLQLGTYQSNSETALIYPSGITIEKGSDTWIAWGQESETPAGQSFYSVSVSSFAAPDTTDLAVHWTVHGVINAELVPGDVSSGLVAMRITF